MEPCHFFSRKDVGFGEVSDDRLFPDDCFQTVANEGSFDLPRLKAALPFAERARIAANLRVVQDLHKRLNDAGWLQYDTLADGLTPLHLLYTRQAMHDVPPLDKAVGTCKRIKKEGDM